MIDCLKFLKKTVIWELVLQIYWGLEKNLSILVKSCKASKGSSILKCLRIHSFKGFYR